MLVKTKTNEIIEIGLWLDCHLHMFGSKLFFIALGCDLLIAWGHDCARWNLRYVAIYSLRWRQRGLSICRFLKSMEKADTSMKKWRHACTQNPTQKIMGKTMENPSNPQMSYSVAPRMVLDQPPRPHAQCPPTNDTSIFGWNLRRRIFPGEKKGGEFSSCHFREKLRETSTFGETAIWDLRIALNPLIHHHWLMMIIDYHQLVTQW